MPAVATGITAVTARSRTRHRTPPHQPPPATQHATVPITVRPDRLYHTNIVRRSRPCRTLVGMLPLASADGFGDWSFGWGSVLMGRTLTVDPRAWHTMSETCAVHFLPSRIGAGDVRSEQGTDYRAFLPS